MKNLFVFLFAMIATLAIGQDYVMYETHTLTPKEGHVKALEEAVAKHNKLYHAEGPYENFMFSILNGPRSGDLLFAMGSCTFSHLDDRPSSEAHNKDWNAVLSHCEGGAKNIEYWRLEEELSHDPKGISTATKPLCRVRYFDVADNAGFRDMQAQFRKVDEAMGTKTPSFMYRNQFQNRQGRDWAIVTWFDSWADLDAGSWNAWKETFIKLYGEDGWKKLGDEYDDIILSREDEMRVRRLDLQAPDKKE
jgi:hypothetical protein